MLSSSRSNNKLSSPSYYLSTDAIFGMIPVVTLFVKGGGLWYV